MLENDTLDVVDGGKRMRARRAELRSTVARMWAPCTAAGVGWWRNIY